VVAVVVVVQELAEVILGVVVAQHPLHL